MPRLRNAAGVEVDVSDATAAKLDGFEPVEKAKPEPKKATTRTSDK